MFELRGYANWGTGDETVIIREYQTRAAARSTAGRLACKIDGPVDIATAGDAEWADRYMTTARPSQFHVAGYAFERLT